MQICKELSLQVYFDRDFTLLERPPGRPEPGHFPWIANFAYSLPFECPLPLGCPTSYEGPHAFIRYHVRATIVEDNGTGTVGTYLSLQSTSQLGSVDNDNDNDNNKYPYLSTPVHSTCPAIPRFRWKNLSLKTQRSHAMCFR